MNHRGRTKQRRRKKIMNEPRGQDKAEEVEKLMNEPRGQEEAEKEEGSLNKPLGQNSDEGPYFLSIKTVLKATNRAGPWTLHESSIWSGP